MATHVYCVSVPSCFTLISLDSDHQLLIDRLRSGDTRALARSISTVENREPGSSDLLKALFPHSGKARIIGVTGPPGAGKSTLVDHLARLYRKENRPVGIIGMDPPSASYVGAVLGDRFRMQDHFYEPRVYIRCVASPVTLVA